MTTGWTEERRQKQRERIMHNRPWEKSTGPKTAEGKLRSSLNSLTNGRRTRLSEDFLRLLKMHRELTKITFLQMDVLNAPKEKLTSELLEQKKQDKVKALMSELYSET